MQPRTPEETAFAPHERGVNVNGVRSVTLAVSGCFRYKQGGYGFGRMVWSCGEYVEALSWSGRLCM